MPACPVGRPLLLLAALVARAAAAAPAGPAGTAADDRPPEVAARVELAGLAGLACEGDRCLALVDGRLRAVDPLTLALGEEQAPTWGHHLFAAPAPTLLDGCEATPSSPDGTPETCARPLADPTLAPAPVPTDRAAPPSPDQVARAWNQARASGDRLPFAARVPAPDGGLLTTVREPQGHRVMRIGGAARFMDATLGAGGPGYRRALALHPTGREAYAVAAPGSALVAFDPRDLGIRWILPLRPVAHGLFVDPTGRLLLAEEGGEPDPDALLDLGAQERHLPAGAAPGSDLALALAERPDAASTAVIDLAAPRLVWREDGRYLSLQALPDGACLLATDRALVRLVLPPPSSP
ncbi:hypothetical protein L6R53_20855 [Myxococcota bacterium]|nr:hypothetical protein [Myxococcota bacterium]